MTFTVGACLSAPKSVGTDPAVADEKTPVRAQRDEVDDHAEKLVAEGREIFRYRSSTMPSSSTSPH